MVHVDRSGARWLGLVTGVCVSLVACSEADPAGAPGTPPGQDAGAGGRRGTGGAGGVGLGGRGAGGAGGGISQGGAGGHGGGAGGHGGGAAPVGASVLGYHGDASRAGVHVDAALTKAAAATFRADPAFHAVTHGAAYAQPLFVDGGATGADLVIVATEENWVHVFLATTGTVVWEKHLGAPVPLAALPCGNIDPLGVTGTPVVDLASRTLFLDAMTEIGGVPRHLVHALSLDDGAARPGWPLDVSASVSANGLAFDSTVQNQRGALAIVGGMLYVPYGGHWGDCGDYHGWLVAIPLADPGAPQAWATPARGGGSWAPGGVASDGTSTFITTGNTFGADTWSGGEAVIRFGSGLAFTGQASQFFAPTDWKALDQGDVDIGGSGPVLFDLPGATPSALALALGKSGKAYLLDREALGGVSGGAANALVASGEIIGAAAAYATAAGTYFVFKGAGADCPHGNPGDLTAIAVAPGAPPSMSTAWCALENGLGSPMVTTTDGHSEAIVWGLGAEGDGRLHGFDGDTGATVFDGGGPGDALAEIRRYATPIPAKGRIFVAGDGQLVAFAPK